MSMKNFHWASFGGHQLAGDVYVHLLKRVHNETRSQRAHGALKAAFGPIDPVAKRALGKNENRSRKASNSISRDLQNRFVKQPVQRRTMVEKNPIYPQEPGVQLQPPGSKPPIQGYLILGLQRRTKTKPTVFERRETNNPPIGSPLRRFEINSLLGCFFWGEKDKGSTRTTSTPSTGLQGAQKLNPRADRELLSHYPNGRSVGFPRTMLQEFRRKYPQKTKNWQGDRLTHLHQSSGFDGQLIFQVVSQHKLQPGKKECPNGTCGIA